MNREPGFYWVRHKLTRGAEYEIGCFHAEVGWTLASSDEWFHDSELEIDERRITREEIDDESEES